MKLEWNLNRSCAFSWSLNFSLAFEGSVRWEMTSSSHWDRTFKKQQLAFPSPFPFPTDAVQVSLLNHAHRPHLRRWWRSKTGRTWIPGWWCGARQAVYLFGLPASLGTVKQQRNIHAPHWSHWSFRYLHWIRLICFLNSRDPKKKVTWLSSGPLTLAKNLISWSWGDFSVFPLLTMASTKTQVTQSWPQLQSINQSQHFRNRAAFLKAIKKGYLISENIFYNVLYNCAG